MLHIDLYMQHEHQIDVVIKNDLGIFIEKKFKGQGHLNALLLESLDELPNGHYTLEISFGDTRVLKSIEKISAQLPANYTL